MALSILIGSKQANNVRANGSGILGEYAKMLSSPHKNANHLPHADFYGLELEAVRSSSIAQSGVRSM